MSTKISALVLLWPLVEDRHPQRRQLRRPLGVWIIKQRSELGCLNVCFTLITVASCGPVIIAWFDIAAKEGLVPVGLQKPAMRVRIVVTLHCRSGGSKIWVAILF